MGCRIRVLILAPTTSSLPRSPLAEHRAGEAKDESKAIPWINNQPASAGLAEGHHWSRRACFNAEPKHEARRLHLAHAIQHSACQSRITNCRSPEDFPRSPPPSGQVSWVGKAVISSSTATKSDESVLDTWLIWCPHPHRATNGDGRTESMRGAPNGRRAWGKAPALKLGQTLGNHENWSIASQRAPDYICL